MLRHFLRIVLPVVVIAISSGMFWYLQTQTPLVATQVPKKRIPTAQIISVIPQTVRVPITTQGIIEPNDEVILTSQTRGKITWLSPKLNSGHFFNKSERLATIDPTAAQQQLRHANAQLLNAQQALATAQAEWAAEQQLTQQLNQGRTSPPLSTPTTFYQHKAEELKAHIEAAQLDIHLAQQQLDNTTLIAPFNGRIRMALVSLGQTVAPGSEVAHLYTTDHASIRLPLTDRQWYHMPSALNDLLPITLLTENHQELFGTNCRAEGSLDPGNRLRYLNCDVPQAFNSTHHPVWAGQWVQAQLLSHEYHNIVILPRTAVHNEQWVWRISKDNRLQKQLVQILYRSPSSAYLQSNWQPNQRILLQPLTYHIENMKVNPVEATDRLATQQQSGMVHLPLFDHLQ